MNIKYLCGSHVWRGYGSAKELMEERNDRIYVITRYGKRKDNKE